MTTTPHKDDSQYEQLSNILKAPMRSEVSTADIVTGMWSSTMLSEKIHDIQALIAKAAQEARKEHMQTSYLNLFTYSDWEVGDDNRLGLGDYINCNHQRPHDGYEQNFEGQIVEHYVNDLPIILYNIDPKDPDNSGEFADLQSLMMDGWEFSRLAALQANKEKS